MVDAGNFVINRYVKSLYEVAISREIGARILVELDLIKKYISEIEDYKKFLKRISLLTKNGENFISQLADDLKLSKEMSNFLALLLKNGRLSIIVEICDCYVEFTNKIRGRKIFYVTYAKTFPKTEEKKLIGNLREVFGGEIECVSSRDPSLLGGIKVQFRSKILDYSVKSRLARLHRALRGDAYEN